MLISFSVRNFLSFNQEVELSMVASQERIHPHHVSRTSSRKHPNLLRAAAIYGANASGKSNLVEAIRFVQDLVVEGLGPDSRIPVQRFKLDPSCLHDPAYFKIEFRVNNINYSYRLVIEPEKIIQEDLITTTSTSETILFSRRTSNRGDVQIKFGPFFLKLSEKERQFLEFVAQGTRPNQLFVREARERNVERFRPVYNWFRRTLQLIKPDTEYTQLESRLDTDQTFKDFFCRVLTSAGTGITEIRTEEMSTDSLIGVPEELLQEVREQISGEEIGFVKGIGGRRFALIKRGDELRVLKLTTVHGSSEGRPGATFEIHEESDGTQRLLDLIPMLYDLTVGKRNRVYVVDEVGRSLHPHLTNMLLGAHLDRANADYQSQLIITTHETNLLDLDILRRDEIWFVEKREDGSTDIYSLSDFQPRYDKNIRRDYLIGRYGAIPFIGSIQPLYLFSGNTQNAEVKKSGATNAS